jgi:hypothetical protein
VSLALLLLVQAAGAETSFFVWNQTSLQFSNLGNATATASATGVATVHTSSSFSSHLSTLSLASGVSLVTAVQVTDPTQAPILDVVFDVRQRPDLQGGVFGFTGGGGVSPNTLPMSGMVTLCLIDELVPCVGQLHLPLGATASGNWIGHGVGGILTVGGTGSIRISMLGAAYTIATVSVPFRTENGGIEVATARGFAHGPFSATSSSAQTSGVIQLVTATRIHTEGSGDMDLAGSISTSLIHLVHIPEPGRLTLLLSGAGLLTLLGWRKNRRRGP